MNPEPKINVYIVDDDADVRRSTWFVMSEAGFNPRAFASGIDLLDQLDQLPFGIVILDVNMPDRGGIDVLRNIVASTNPLPVIMVTGCGEVSGAVSAMKIGAKDFIEKPYSDYAMTALVEETAAAHRRQEDADKDCQASRRKLEDLTVREREVLTLLMSGMPNKVIAYRLGISPRTVEMHRASMMSSLGVSSLSSAIRVAIAAGLAPPSGDNRTNG